MTIRSSRTDGRVNIRIDREACIRCGRCVAVCEGAPLHLDDGQIKVDHARGFGCIGCGHCMMVCPQNCITIDGRCLSPADIVPRLPAEADYDSLLGLMLRRRSIRRFADREVSREDIDRILAAAATAPMGIPPFETGVAVLSGREKTAAFVGDMMTAIRKMKWLFAGVGPMLMRPFMSKDAHDAFVSFVPVLMKTLLEEYERGEDKLFYRAPLAMIFHTSPFADPLDGMIVATYATLAAESLGIGSCMIGSIAPLLKRNKELKKKYGIPEDHSPAIAVIFGHPAHEFPRAVRRTLAGVTFV